MCADVRVSTVYSIIVCRSVCIENWMPITAANVITHVIVLETRHQCVPGCQGTSSVSFFLSRTVVRCLDNSYCSVSLFGALSSSLRNLAVGLGDKQLLAQIVFDVIVYYPLRNGAIKFRNVSACLCLSATVGVSFSYHGQRKKQYIEWLTWKLICG